MRETMRVTIFITDRSELEAGYISDKVLSVGNLFKFSL